MSFDDGHILQTYRCGIPKMLYIPLSASYRVVCIHGSKHDMGNINEHENAELYICRWASTFKGEQLGFVDRLCFPFKLRF